MAIINNNENKEPSIVNLLIYKNHLVDTGFRVKYDELVNTVLYNAYLDKSTNKLCFQQESGDLCFDFSLTGLPDVNVDAATAGDVLVYNGTNWEAKYLGDVLNYTRNQQSSRFSDITSITSITDALDKILYPFIAPSFTTFTIQGQSNTLELGEYLSGTNGGNKTFTWGVSTVANVSSIIGYKITDVTNGNFTIANSILPTTLLSSTQNIPYSIVKTINGATNVFRILGKDLQGTFFNRDLTLTWRPRIFWGTSSVSTALNNSQIMTLPSTNTGGSLLTNDITNSFTMDGNGEYIWICMPVSFGKAIETNGSNSRFLVGGLANSFWTLFTVNFTNQFGFTSPYYLYRSNVISFGTAIKIDII
jgi:hypothetical protein